MNEFVRKWFRWAAEAFFLCLSALAIAAALNINRSALPPLPTFLREAVLALAGVGLTQFHLKHVALGTIRPLTASRILMTVSLAAIVGVQVLQLALSVSQASTKGFLVAIPLLAGSMLISAMLGPSLAVFATTVLCLVLGISESATLPVLIVAWLGSTVSAHSVNPIRRRSDLLRVVSISGICIGIAALVTQVILNGSPREQLESFGWAALGAVIASSVFWMSTAVVERFFDLTSDWTLLELCSPDHPLLREMVLRAPGTYAHSVMVGNLAENAARDIGANPVVCRAMAYFHDIGKLVRPSLFIENQSGYNPHDDLAPQLSANVLMAHVHDGIDLAKKNRLPRLLREAISEHHGTSLIAFFLHRARQLDPEVSERTFRYQGPKPQSRETALIMLADSAEAVSRTIQRGQSEELEVAVQSLIEDRRADGQLDECQLTLKDLQVIKKSFLRTLGALRHERIPYPEAELPYAAKSTEDLDLKHLLKADQEDSH